ncbi:phosphate ABC transporter substrate-binding protein PstS [Zymobacter sp. IVIA_12111.31 C1]|uniref:phosphate ABC transporter substrate-binding protein PstS n=1 Tax=Zymobacter sp. IVIA_12111.31 C1 TaxID=3394854 RepID=UPI0039C3DFE8
MLKRTTIALTMLLSAPLVQAAPTVTGAGATFPYPVYTRWADDYQDAKNVAINYQGIGSGGGIAQIKARTVTFGASDVPMSAEDQQKAGLVQWPMIMGGVVPIVNLGAALGGNSLKLDGETLAAIYSGDITRWNDARIKALNPDINLPDLAITPVHRAEGSGTNYLFTHYLSEVSPAFKQKVGEGNTVPWPNGVGAQANGGVASRVQGTVGAIGYVEYAYARQNKVATVVLKNRDGGYVTPGADSFSAAARHADWKNAPGLALVLTNQPGKDSWPITGVSYILMPVKPADAAAAKEALAFFNWAYVSGKDTAAALDYVAMPKNVIDQVEHDVWSKITDGSTPLWLAQ